VLPHIVVLQDLSLIWLLDYRQSPSENRIIDSAFLAVPLLASDATRANDELNEDGISTRFTSVKPTKERIIYVSTYTHLHVLASC